MISSSEVQRKLLARNASRTVNRHDFPEDFVFGTATSAYQHEGATAEDGRGPSIWDTFTLKTRGRVKDNSNANVSVDTYHRYKEDVKLMKKIGLNAYRFSISWSRVLPGGSLAAGVNKEGIKYYNNLIDALLTHGIEPYVTLFHWDLPQALEYQYGGFLSPQIIKDFCEFASLCFWEFGDRVKHWITLNDPWTFCFGGYVMGTMAPWRGSSAGHVKGSIACQRGTHGCACICHNGNPGTEPYLVAHNMLLAHATAVDLYKQKFQQLQEGKIGITLFSKWFEPLYDNELDEEAAARAFDFMLGWFLEPLTSGEYPESMIKLVGSRLPLFSTEESKLIKGSYDFLGLKYYTATYVKSESNSHGLEVSYTTDPRVTYTKVPIGPKAASDWLYIYPQGIYKLLVYIKGVYNVPLIYITENGVDEMNNTSLTVSESLVDDIRIKYHQDHLLYIRYAIVAGVNVKGYFIWSLFDGFEWSQGYTVRFGIFHVNFKDGLARFPKNSALWLMSFLNRKLAKGRMKRQIEDREEHNPVKRIRTR